MFKQKSIYEIQTSTKNLHRYECDSSTPLHEILQVLDYMIKEIKNKLSEMEESQEKEEENIHEEAKEESYEEAGV